MSQTEPKWLQRQWDKFYVCAVRVTLCHLCVRRWSEQGPMVYFIKQLWGPDCVMFICAHDILYLFIQCTSHLPRHITVFLTWFSSVIQNVGKCESRSQSNSNMDPINKQTEKHSRGDWKQNLSILLDEMAKHKHKCLRTCFQALITEPRLVDTGSLERSCAKSCSHQV
jgi:hypothetical protein